MKIRQETVEYIDRLGAICDLAMALNSESNAIVDVTYSGAACSVTVRVTENYLNGESVLYPIGTEKQRVRLWDDAEVGQLLRDLLRLASKKGVTMS